MKKREAALYAITTLSLIAFVFIVFSAFPKIPNKGMGLTGNAVLEFEDNFEVGDSLSGGIIINSNELDKYGVLLLTKENKPLVAETFNLNYIAKQDNGKYSVDIQELVDYKFEEKGRYELMFSVLDLNINIKKEILVK